MRAALTWDDPERAHAAAGQQWSHLGNAMAIPPMTGIGKHSTYGDDWGMVSSIVFLITVDGIITE